MISPFRWAVNRAKRRFWIEPSLRRAERELELLREQMRIKNVRCGAISEARAQAARETPIAKTPRPAALTDENICRL